MVSRPQFAVCSLQYMVDLAQANMDPHSRLSQYNHRLPKSGPFLNHHRLFDSKSTIITVDGLLKKDSPARKMTISKGALTVQRPIASNSRVRGEERQRKDMYLAFVNNAFLQKAEGFNEPFEELIGQFNIEHAPDGASNAPNQLRLWITALSHVVSKLDRQHAALVDAIIALPWTNMDSSFVKSYTAFIGMLASARPEYLQRILNKLVQGLTHQSGFKALDVGMPESSASPLTRRTVYDRLHALLQHLLSLVPTMVTTLHPILVRHFPHKRQSLATHITYIRNILRISEYCPSLADRIMNLIIDRTIQIDVEIQIELEELETEPEMEVFTLDPFDTVVGQEEEPESDSEDSTDEIDDLSDLSSDVGDEADSDKPLIDIPTNMNNMLDTVKKLDCILDLIFDHLTRTHSLLPTSTPFPVFAEASEGDTLPGSDNAKETYPTVLSFEHPNVKAMRRMKFQSLLSIFDRTIIRTFKSRYTQFLLFWYSSLDPEYSDILQGYLVSKALLEEDQPVVTRAAAASYIASFVSRAQFVDRNSTRRVVGILCDFLENYLVNVESRMERVESDVSAKWTQNAVFYTVAQAVFLVFCFRWRDLLESHDEDEADNDGLYNDGVMTKGSRKWMRELNVVQRIINSSLNPLQMCSQAVVQQFARVAQHVDFVYCYSIMEANKWRENSPSFGINRQREKPRQTAAVNGTHKEADLTTFFPFDPYKLPKSSSYIQGIYREWSSVAVCDDEDSDDEDVEEYRDNHADADASEKSLGIPINRTSSSLRRSESSDGLGESFGGMSISPLRTLNPIHVS